MGLRPFITKLINSTLTCALQLPQSIHVWAVFPWKNYLVETRNDVNDVFKMSFGHMSSGHDFQWRRTLVR